MASYFNLTLDTTAPQNPSILINGGATATNDANVTLTLGAEGSDLTSVKIWGIDGVAGETDAEWESFTQQKAVALTTGDGLKTVYVKYRDDVGNETAAVSATITLNTAVPTVNINYGPSTPKISKMGNFDASTFKFYANVDIAEYKVCVVADANATQENGTVIPTTHGSVNMSDTTPVAAETQVESTVKGGDLELASAGDGIKIVKVFVKTALGTWSV